MKERLTAQEEEELNIMTRLEQELGFYEAAKQYEQIPVPEELDDLVRRTIQEQTARKEKNMKKAAFKRTLQTDKN